MPTTTLQQRADELGREVFLGGRAERFELDGRLQLIALLRRGLMPDSHVIDVGCGALRAGYWLIHFLDAGRYHGIEPSRDRMDGARARLLEPGLEELKRPTFDDNDAFDLSVFGVAPRFVLARSIWSHAAKRQIEAMLDSFAAVAAPDALLLASYHPAGRRTATGSLPERVARNSARLLRGALADRGGGEPSDQPGSEAVRRRVDRHRERERERGRPPSHRDLPDYLGTAWGGGVDPGGLVAHRFEWIEDACRVRSLSARESLEDGFGNQVWLEIRRA